MKAYTFEKVLQKGKNGTIKEIKIKVALDRPLPAAAVGGMSTQSQSPSAVHNDYLLAQDFSANVDFPDDNGIDNSPMTQFSQTKVWMHLVHFGDAIDWIKH